MANGWPDVSYGSYGRIWADESSNWSPWAPQPDGLLFIDLADLDIHHRQGDATLVLPRLATGLRQAPWNVLQLMRRLLIRWPMSITESNEEASTFGELLRDVALKLSLRCSIQLVSFPVGMPPEVWTVGKDGALARESELDPYMLARARATELHTLLEWGRAIWRPGAYHYRLADGTHAGAFVRLADAIRTPRDAQALASWLHCRLAEGMGFILDTATLTPLALALQASLRDANWASGPVAVVDGYPETVFDAAQAVRVAHHRTYPVLAILSVNSSGRLMGRLFDALTHNVEEGNPWFLEVLVDKQGEPTVKPMRMRTDQPVNTDTHTDTWLRLHSPTAYGEAGCTLCRSPETARVLQIDPWTFQTMTIPAPELLVPAHDVILKAADFWTVADSCGAVALSTLSDYSTRLPDHPRAKRPMAVKVSLAALVAHGGQRLLDACEHRIDEARRHLENPDPRTEPRPLAPYDAILLDGHEAKLPGFDDFVRAFAQRLLDSPNATLVSHGSDDWDKLVQQSKRVLILQTGLVSGRSLHDRIVAAKRCHARMSDEASTIHVLVVHARPEDERTLSTLRMSAGNHFAALWTTYLRETSASPQDEEKAVLAGTGALSQPLQALASARASLAEGSTDELPVLWDVSEDHKLTSGSWYGDQLGIAAAFAAIGSALQFTRLERPDEAVAPLWRQFDMPYLLESVSDPLELVCIFRWIRPQEMWWGREPRDAKLAMSALIARHHDTLPKILPELLLAAGQGKIPTREINLLINEVDRLPRESQSNYLLLGKALAERRLSGYSPMAQGDA